MDTVHTDTEKRPPDVPAAIAAAVAAIYFMDSSDYLGALWDTVRALDPAMAALLEQDPRHAFHMAHPDLDPDLGIDRPPST